MMCDRIELFVKECERVVSDKSIGYSQADREGEHNRDCSSLVCRALRVAGFDAPYPSFSTRTMGAWLLANGWEWCSDLSQAKRGDILWKNGHTAVVTSPGFECEAYRGDMSGGINGRPGNQLGYELRANVPFSAWYWSGFYRYKEEDMSLTDDDIERIANKVWEHKQARTLTDRVYRMLSGVKAMCGIGAEDTSDLKNRAEDIYKNTCDRWARTCLMLKVQLGIPLDDSSVETIEKIANKDVDTEK